MLYGSTATSSSLSMRPLAALMEPMMAVMGAWWFEIRTKDWSEGS